VLGTPTCPAKTDEPIEMPFGGRGRIPTNVHKFMHSITGKQLTCTKIGMHFGPPDKIS